MKGSTVSAIAVGVLLANSIPAFAQDEPDRILLLTGATVIDGVSDAPLTGRSVLIENGTISALPPGGSPAPAGAEVIDLGGRFVIPGLVDSHVHWLDWMGELFLNHGVTTIVAMADIDAELRARSHLDERLPRIYHSGARIPFSPGDEPGRIREIVEAWLANVKARESFQPAIWKWMPDDLTGQLRVNGAKSWPEVAALLDIEAA